MSAIKRRNTIGVLAALCAALTACAVQVRSAAPASVTTVVHPRYTAEDLAEVLAYNSVAAKKELRAFAQAQPQPDTGLTCEAAETLLMDSAMRGETRAERAQDMTAYGLYQLDTPVVDAPAMYSGSSDVTVEPVEVYYNTSNDTWVLLMSGEWSENGWRDDQLTSGKIGGPDSFGYGFYRTNDSFHSALVSCHATTSAYDGSERDTSTSRDYGDSSTGLGFEMQDERISHAKMTLQRFSCSGSYDSDFAEFHGLVAAYYVHTWDECRIQSISFGASSEGVAEIGIEVSDESTYFDAYSADTRF